LFVRQPEIYERPKYAKPARRRPWLVALPLAVVVLIGVCWSAFWFYAASQVGPAIDGWRAREAKAGRIHTCDSQDIAGYPFRIEVDCKAPSVEFQPASALRLSDSGRPLVVTAKDIAVVAQVYDPTLLIAEIASPMTVTEKGQPPTFSVNWSLAQVSVRGTPAEPQRISIAVDRPEFANFNRGAMELVATANHVELHGRIASGSVNNNPQIELVTRLVGAVAPSLHPMLAQPTDSEISATLTGLKDFAPKPWSERFREIAAANGHIEIKQARLSQGDVLAVGAGTLSLNANGKLDGQLTLTVVGLDKLITRLGADQAMSQYLAQKGGNMNMDKIGGALDRLLPGLGGAVRNNSGAIAAAGISMLGQPADIEGKKGITLPLKFTDGAMYLGPIPVGQTPALF
jgi:hypothetical protein